MIKFLWNTLKDNISDEKDHADYVEIKSGAVTVGLSWCGFLEEFWNVEKSPPCFLEPLNCMWK